MSSKASSTNGDDMTAPAQTSSRHRWGEAVRFAYKTERECVHCRIVKVTRHEPGVWPWAEFWRDGVRMACTGTPQCVGARVTA